MWVGIMPSVEGPERTKRWRKGEVASSAWLSWDISLLLALRLEFILLTVGVLRPSYLNAQIYAISSPGSPHANYRSWHFQPPWSCEPIPHNLLVSIATPVYIYTYLYLSLSLSLSISVISISIIYLYLSLLIAPVSNLFCFSGEPW